MARLLDAWEASKAAPEPVEVAVKSARDTALDVLTAREEFRAAGRQVAEGVSLGDPARRDAGTIVGGLGAGLATAGLFVFPGGRSGQLAGVAGRGTKRAALRAAAGLGDEAFGGAAGGAKRRFNDPARSVYEEFAGMVQDPPAYSSFVSGVEEAAAGALENGFSWSPSTSKFYRLGVDSEVMVGVSPQHTLTVPVENFTPQDIVRFFRQTDDSGRTVARVLSEDPSTVVGGWVDDIDGVPHVFLDVSRAYRSVDEAMQVGGLLGERAVIDLGRTTFDEASQTIPNAYRPGGRLFNPDAMSIPGAAQKDSSALSPLLPGKWSENPTAELVPARWLDQFKEHTRTGKRVDDLVPQIRERGFDDPLILEVGMNGRATLIEGNHRLAAAQRLGLEEVPVRVVTARTVAGGAEVPVRDVGAGKLLRPSEVVSTDVAPAISFPAEPAPSSGLVLPKSLLRDAGGYDANIPGERVREMAEELVQRQLDAPVGAAALDPREIAATLEGLPEFSDFVRAYRETVIDSMKNPIDRRKLRPGALNEYARLARLETPGWSAGVKTDKSFPAALKGTLPEALQAGAVNLGIRIRNMGTFATDDLLYPAYYLDFNKKLLEVSGQTGMPIEVLSAALASASSQAAPYDEVLRFASVARLVTVENGRAKAISGAYELLGDDNMAVTTLRGLIDSVNNPDFLTVKPSGHAMKTSPYAYGRIDPLYPAFYVADTVDALGQFLIAGGKSDTAKAPASVVNQIAGRTLANVYGVPNSAAQEGFWGQIRVVRDGLKLTKSGKPTQVSLPAAFTGSKGPVEDILVSAVESMDPRVVALARSNRDKFYEDVKSGTVAAWNWDKTKSRPVISSVDYLVPSDQRLVAGGRGVALQGKMLELVESLGPALRSRLLAIAATSGISLAVLVRALGDAAMTETGGTADA